MNEPDEREFDALRDSYGELPQESPGRITDARILAEAHRAVKRRHTAGWIGVVALAASIGFAVVLVPNLLLEKPALDSSSKQFVSVAPASAPPTAKEEQELERVQVTGSRINRMDIEESSKLDAAEQPAAALSSEPADAVRREMPARMMAESTSEDRQLDFVAAERSRLMSQAEVQAIPDAEALREELAGADEMEWRATLVTLRDNDRRQLAEQLMPEYRRKFELDDSLTLDMLVAEVN